MVDKPELATSEEVAEYLHCNVVSVRRWIKSGRLEARRVGRRWLIKWDSVLRMVEEGGEGLTREQPK